MWDIIAYVDSEISLLLKQRDVYYVFKYPWREPKALPAMLTSPRAEAISVPSDRLLQELIIRSRIAALDHTCSLARGALGTSPAQNNQQLVTEALKFALRRKKNNLIPASEFIRMLTSCALIAVIPDSFWGACSSEIDEETLEKLRLSLGALEVLHPRSESWLVDAAEYLNRILWAQNQFSVIENTCRQLSYQYAEEPIGKTFAELRKRAASMIKREEIEQDLLNQKPWQKNALPVKRSIRVGPQSKSKPDRPSEQVGKKTEEDSE